MPELNRRVLAPDELKTLMLACFSAGGEFPLVVTGSSMNPFLVSGRDKVFLRPAPERLRRGDIAFYQRASGRLVLHRVCRAAPDGYWFVGDAQTEIEGPIAHGQILAVAVRVERKGRILQPGSFWWGFFRTAWLCVLPVRRPLMALYERARRTRAGQ